MSMAAVTRSRSAYSGDVSKQSQIGQLRRTVELDVVGSTSAVKDLDVNLALGQGGHVNPHNGEYSLNNLSSYNSWLRKARAHDKDVDAQAVRAEGVFDVSYKVTRGIVSIRACGV
jgi:hypothetical protein